MAVVNQTYADSIAKGYAGMVANGEVSNRISRTNEAAAVLPFGRAAFRGTGDHGCVPTVGTAATFLGFAIANYIPQPNAEGVQLDSYPQYASVPIMTQGVLWVTVAEDVTDGAQVYIDADDGSIVDTATDNIAATGWFFQDTVASGGLARIAKR